MPDVINKQAVIDQINALTLDGEFSQEDLNYLVNYLIANGSMTGTPRDLIQIRRGLQENLPNLAQGELALTMDTKALFAGGEGSNIDLSRSAFLPSVENANPTPMTYNSSPTLGSKLRIFDGDIDSPKTEGNVPTASIQRVDDSPGANDSRDHLTALLVTHRRKPTSRGYAFGTYSYLEDESNSTFPSQSVACAGAAHSRGPAQVWGLYGEGWQHDTVGVGTGAELACFNYSGIDNAYADDDTVFVAGHSKALLLGNNGLGVAKKALMALGISATAGREFRAGIYMGRNSCDLYGIDIRATPKTLIRFKHGARDAAGVTAGIGLDTGRDAAYGTGVNMGAIHLWNNTFTFGESDDASYYFRFDQASERLYFGKTTSSGAAVKAWINFSDATVAKEL